MRRQRVLAPAGPLVEADEESRQIIARAPDQEVPTTRAPVSTLPGSGPKPDRVGRETKAPRRQSTASRLRGSARRGIHHRDVAWDRRAGGLSHSAPGPEQTLPDARRLS